ncbi:MAG: CBS domain-containing protein [Betaproteobacteria bacterium]|jgi:CBS domain-containing protein|nr:CBS domain-containing protein [Betaproteobacteria bacterium]
MKTIRQLLQSKSGGLCTIGPGASVLDALKLMAEKNIGALLVVENDKLVGIISERDYARKVVLRGKSSQDTPVREIMTERAVCVQPDNTVEECMALMTDKHVRHLPVIENEKVIGVLSIGDLVKETISEQQFVIQQLESYIHS